MTRIAPDTPRMIQLASTAEQKGIISAKVLERLQDGKVSHQDLRAAKKAVKEHGTNIVTGVFNIVGAMMGMGSNSLTPNDGLVRELREQVQAHAKDQGFFRTLGESIKDVF
jgi:hypothetical protein